MIRLLLLLLVSAAAVVFALDNRGQMIALRMPLGQSTPPISVPLLVLASFASVCLYMSTRSESPAVAAILTFGMLIFLWLTEFLRSFVNPELLSYLSVINHYTSLLEGKFDTADVVYYLLFTALFVVLSIRHLEPNGFVETVMR